jgi:hypothetical protein
VVPVVIADSVRINVGARAWSKGHRAVEFDRSQEIEENGLLHADLDARNVSSLVDDDQLL